MNEEDKDFGLLVALHASAERMAAMVEKYGAELARQDARERIADARVDLQAALDDAAADGIVV